MMGSAVARPSPPPTSLLARGPWVALVLTALATWIGGSAALEFNRAQVLDGQWWRIVTGNLVHYGPAHARGDILAFLIWASLIEMLDRRLLVIACLVSPVFVGFGVLLLCPDVPLYGGLSGVLNTLFVVLLLLLWRQPWVRRSLPARVIVAATGVGLLAKVAYEFAYGVALLAPDLGDGVALLPAAHAFGFVAGLLTWKFPHRHRA